MTAPNDVTAPDDVKGATEVPAAPAGKRQKRKPRNMSGPEAQESAILDAAAAEFAAVGVRRANVDEVAGRAGVSRSTLYRRFPNKEALLIAVADRLYRRGMAHMESSVSGLGPREAVIEAFAVGAVMVQDDPLMRRLVLEDAEMKGITSSLTSMFVEVVTGRVAATLLEAGAKMPEGDLLQAVEIHVRLVISYLEVPASDESRREPDAVREFATKFLAPMIW